MSTIAAPQGPTKRIITFFGSINTPNSNHFRTLLGALVNEGAQEITILFASPGGSTDDGMALFTFLRALPVKLTMHAVGFVSSIAIPVFLAANQRFASENSRFYFHDATWTFPSPVATRTSVSESALLMESALDWTRQVLKASTKLTDKDIELKRLLKEPYLMQPTEATEKGLVHQISEPTMSADYLPVVVS